MANLKASGYQPEHLDAAPADTKGFFQGAMASMNPCVAAGKFKPFDGETDLVPCSRRHRGVKAQERTSRP